MANIGSLFLAAVMSAQVAGLMLRVDPEAVAVRRWFVGRGGVSWWLGRAAVLGHAPGGVVGC